MNEPSGVTSADRALNEYIFHQMNSPSEILFQPIPLNKQFHDITGMVFGYLTVLGLAESSKNKHGNTCYKWFCRCSCGKISVARSINLKSGNTTSCGCFRVKVLTDRVKTHGKSNSATYSTWSSMITRCTNKNELNFKYYGGRGVSVCGRWMCSFESFLEDMGERPPGCSIDRINNSGNYEPGNCRWSTRREQCRNKRSNKLITHCGVTKCLADWLDDFKLNRNIYEGRIRRGWTEIEAITSTRPKHKQKYTKRNVQVVVA